MVIIIESYDFMNWKSHTKAIESSSCLHTGPSKTQTLCLTVLSKRSLNSGPCGCAHCAGQPALVSIHSPIRTFFYHPTCTFPDTIPSRSLKSCCCHQKAELSVAALLLWEAAAAMRPHPPISWEKQAKGPQLLLVNLDL